MEANQLSDSDKLPAFHKLRSLARLTMERRYCRSELSELPPSLVMPASLIELTLSVFSKSNNVNIVRQMFVIKSIRTDTFFDDLYFSRHM